MPNVAIVIVNWNGYEDTLECIRSLAKIDHADYRIIVVDNGSTDGSAEKLAYDFPAGTVIKNTENSGFAKGTNIGIRFALRSDPGYVLLLNNDTVVAPDFLEQLISYSEKDPAVGMASPKIYYKDEPDMIWFAGADLNRTTGASKHRGYRKYDNGSFNVPGPSARLTGACMLVKRSVIDKIGLLDEEYFHILEETDWCIRAEKAGFKLVYVPSSKIWHKVSASSGGEYSAVNAYYRSRNILLLFKKHFGLNPVLIAKVVIKSLLCIIMSVLGINRNVAMATLSGYLDFFKGNFGRGSYR